MSYQTALRRRRLTFTDGVRLVFTGGRIPLSRVKLPPRRGSYETIADDFNRVYQDFLVAADRELTRLAVTE